MHRSRAYVSGYLVTATLLTFVGCGTSEDTAERPMTSVAVSAMDEPSEPLTGDAVSATDDEGSPLTPGADTSAPRSRIVTLTLSMTVDDVAVTADQLRAYTEEHEGYVERADIRATAGGGAHLELRVPERTLSATRLALRGLGDVTHEQESVEDVTLARADLNARIRNARAHETRLLTVVSDHTGSLADLLEAERELSRVREAIEQLDARARTLEGLTAYAHIHLELTSPSAPLPPPPAQTSYLDDPLGAIVRSAEFGVRAVWAIAVGGAIVVAAIAPGTLAVGIFGLMLYSLSRLLRWRRRASPTEF